MVYFIALFQASEDGYGFWDGGFRGEDLLEAALEGGVFLDVFAVFGEGCGANTVELTTG